MMMQSSCLLRLLSVRLLRMCPFLTSVPATAAPHR